MPKHPDQTVCNLPLSDQSTVLHIIIVNRKDVGIVLNK